MAVKIDLVLGSVITTADLAMTLDVPTVGGTLFVAATLAVTDIGKNETAPVGYDDR